MRRRAGSVRQKAHRPRTSARLLAVVLMVAACGSKPTKSPTNAASSAASKQKQTGAGAVPSDLLPSHLLARLDSEEIEPHFARRDTGEALVLYPQAGRL